MNPAPTPTPGSSYTPASIVDRKKVKSPWSLPVCHLQFDELVQDISGQEVVEKEGLGAQVVSTIACTRVGWGSLRSPSQVTLKEYLSCKKCVANVLLGTEVSTSCLFFLSHNCQACRM